MPSVKYAFISAYLKGQEAKLVKSHHVDSMQTAPGIQDALAAVRETDIGSYLEELPVGSFDYLDECLWRYLGQRFADIQWFKLVPQDVLKLLAAYVAKYDVLNVKAALEGILGGRNARMIPIGAIHDNGSLDELSTVESVDDIINVAARCKLEDYIPALEQYRTDEGARSKLTVQARLDGQYYKNLLRTAGSLKDGALLLHAFALIIDLANLQVTARAMIQGIEPRVDELTIAGGYQITGKTISELLSLKLVEMPSRLENTRYSDVAKEMLANYDRTKSITAVDETIDKHKFRMLRDVLAPRTLSPLVMAWYLILKEIEVRNLRMALKAIVDGVPVHEIRDYLVL